jgi:hypothetical protein
MTTAVASSRAMDPTCSGAGSDAVDLVPPAASRRSPATRTPIQPRALPTIGGGRCDADGRVVQPGWLHAPLRPEPRARMSPTAVEQVRAAVRELTDRRRAAALLYFAAVLGHSRLARRAQRRRVPAVGLTLWGDRDGTTAGRAAFSEDALGDAP